METRSRDKRRTRARLLNAGLRVAARDGIKATTVNSVIAEADSTKGAFFHHFPDRPAYLVALHRRFHDRLFEAVASATAKLPPGRAWLNAAAHAYLDGCLEERGTRGLLLEARSEPGIGEQIEKRNVEAAEQIVPSLEALGIGESTFVARLWIAAVVEVASLEHAAAGPIPEARRALDILLGGREKPADP